MKALTTDYNLGRLTYNKAFDFFGTEVDFKILKFIKTFFPIVDPSRNITVRFISYEVKAPCFHEEVYVNKYLSYTARIVITMEICCDEKVLEHKFSVNHIPIMIGNSYFIINGTKKIMIYQLSRIGGVYYDLNSNNHVTSMRLVSASGSRIELKSNQREVLNIYINSSKKISIASFFDLLDNEKLGAYIEYYKDESTVKLFAQTGGTSIKYALLFGQLFPAQYVHGKFIIKCSQEEITTFMFFKTSEYDYKDGYLYVSPEDLMKCFVFCNKEFSIKVKKGATIKIGSETLLNEALCKKIVTADCTFTDISLLFFRNEHFMLLQSFINSIDKEEDAAEPEETPQESEDDSYEPEAESEDEEEPSNNSSFSPEEEVETDTSLSVEYVIDSVIRDRINCQLKTQYSKEILNITAEDIILLIEYFAKSVFRGDLEKQNYDYLYYKRIKKPEDFIISIFARKLNKLVNNIKYVSADFLNQKSNIDDFLGEYSTSNEIRRLFSINPLVQFLDQANDLSEIEHRRRLSIFNLTNIERFQVSFDCRDINTSYFARICPVQTPEGTNIGLINSLALHAQICNYGFIIAPYYVIKKGVNTGEIVYLNAREEIGHVFTYYNEHLSGAKEHLCRKDGTVKMFAVKDITYMDVSLFCMTSIGGSLIPFISHNEARRVLMGSNMYRQGVPLNRPEAPVVGTGIERVVGDISRSVIKILNDEEIVFSSSKMVLGTTLIDLNAPINIYLGANYKKTNMKTCNNTVTKVKRCDRVSKGQVAIESNGFDDGEIAIGKNIWTAIYPYFGYNFEDSIGMSESLLRDGIFQSIHMIEVDVKAKELDVDICEKITINNPDSSIRNAPHLDERGIVKIGTKVAPGMVLVSKIVPMETAHSNEDQVLHLIFGKEISSFRDISHLASHDVYGIVVDVKYFHRSDDDNMLNVKNNELEILFRYLLVVLEKAVVYGSLDEAKHKKFISTLGQSSVAKLVDVIKKFIVKFNIVDEVLLEFLAKEQQYLVHKRAHLTQILANKGCNIDNNIIEFVKIVIAQHRPIAVGDKLSGRHGNKGVVAKIIPIEDMPFLEDGTIIDMLVNPIGVPNRLNIAQILENLAGLSTHHISKRYKILIKTGNPAKAQQLVKKYLKFKLCNHNYDEAISRLDNDKYLLLRIPTFDSVGFNEIKEILRHIDAPADGRFRIRCGISGEYINRKVFVGLHYFLKLNHMADDKLSARETGGYSAILQHPLPRKTECGGQRLGEMEVWGLQSHGAAYMLLESLGSKSDDREARNRMYENIFSRVYLIVRFKSAGLNVLLRKLNGVGLLIDFFIKNREDISHHLN